jgi:hypothetical protein
MLNFGFRAAHTACLLRGSASVALLCAAAVQAQPDRFQCAPLVASTSRQPAYGPVSGQARCEGFYQRNVSQPFVELVSLTRTPPGAIAADSEGKLALRASPKIDTRLLIQPMRSSPLYRVDAPLPHGTTLVWGSAPMLQATGLRLRDLGFLAHAGGDADPMALAPIGTPAVDNDATAYAVLRSSVALSSLAWRAYRIGTPALSPSGWQTLTSAPLFAWERIELPIPMPADGRRLRIDVRGLDSQGQDLPLLQFVVLGAQDETP